MIEQLIFIILSVILFIVIFCKIIKTNNTGYIAVLFIEAIGIALDFVALLFNKNSFIIQIFRYVFSIMVPAIVIIIEFKDLKCINKFKIAIAKIYLKMNNTKKAKEILLAVVENNPVNYEAHKLLAKIYEKEGGIRKAIDEYVMCIDINKKDYDSYYIVAILLKESEKKDEAIEMLRNLLEKKPDYYDATIVLGDLLIEKDRIKEATAFYIDALKYNPVDYELYYCLGITYTMLNDFKSAKEFYEKAAEINSILYNAKYNLGLIALLYKEVDTAKKYFEESIESEELQADAYYELAQICIMKGEKDLAIKYANIAIDLDSKKISEKIKKETLFIPILSKISIPFNLEEKEDASKLSEKEQKAKEHLEKTENITRNMGYGNLEFKRQDVLKQETKINESDIERTT